ncbi:RNA 2',3'-cyclic phosphodiesterase [Meiothermus granaticius]|uniref:RNA 2',3'-cyclic phosphodiesterase n=1 Tax=Meiothermus granaticius NBRC 107808 TaxID=1227551 RepID=A0A399F6W1_9DEIN|nr:RNA 2',3'-cyclic phosphodiesterase [Meiothermus granaticius]RIH91019.1 RNA 2',3'-cyclic phosphodiesterase [Meiothermus granaticius NBRC 107808]GEM88320.1 RNA 2',3'-cyclic phosphodiesterase [Meiothermus granaticius NBRC 107808]
MRLFYAIFPPKAIQQALVPTQEALRHYKGWKLAPPEQLHITLLFLGEVHNEGLEHVSQVGRTVARSVPPFEVRLGGTGYFPASGSPRVWFVKAEGEGLEPLASGLRRALPEFERAERFHPHLTLARKKGPAPRIGPQVLGLRFQAKAVCLVESRLEKSGSKYEVLEVFPL